MLKKIQKIDIKSTEFPSRLREIPDPPAQLYCSGDISLLNEVSAAVVGSRKYTLYGRNVAVMIGSRLAECGIPVVSGLAYGIDAFSHEGALDAGGKIIGVLPGGIRNMVPVRNRDLMNRGISQGGLVVSEYEPDAKAFKYTYPRRNRIISGLSSCVAVVEANVNSGSLSTAQHAMEQGRTVYAVPGNITSQFSIGCNLLIRDGAYPLVVIDDLIRELGVDPSPVTESVRRLGEDEKKVFNSVSKYNGIMPDIIAEETGLTVAAVNALVTVMEIKGIFQTYGGKIYVA